MNNKNDQNFTTVKDGSTFLKLEKLKSPFFRLVECSNNLPHKPGTIVIAVTNSSGNRDFIPFSSDQVTGIEYIPEGEYNWGKLSLDQIGIINGTDKSSTKHNYLEVIDDHLSKKYGPNYRASKPQKILEIGICNGASLRTFAKAFQNSKITGIDISSKCSTLCKDLENATIIIDDATKKTCLRPDQKFDLIIDDGSHSPADALKSFLLLFENHLMKGGTYIIEDIDCFYKAKYARKLSSSIEDFKESRKDLFDHLVLGSIKNKINESITSLQIHANMIIVERGQA